MKRITRFIIGLFIIALTLFLAREPIFRAIGSFLVVENDLKKADVIIVLSGDNERVREAVSLYQRGFSEYMIMTGSSWDGKTNRAQAMKSQAMRSGIPEERIILEPEARHTYEHPVFVKPILRARGFQSAIVVSSPYHMRRSAMLFDRAFKNSGIELIYYPAQKSWFKVEEWWKNVDSRKTVRLEYIKMFGNIFGNRAYKAMDNSINAYLED